MIRLVLALLLAAAPIRAATDIVEVTSEGGITAWLVEDHAIPIIAISVEFEGGALLDPDGLEGVTRMMMGLLEEGAGDLDAVGFAEAREALAAGIHFQSGRQTVSLSLNMLQETLDETVDLVVLALTEPRFDAAAIARIRAQMLAGAEAALQDPGAIAGRAFRDAVYGDHPLSRDEDGTPDSIAAITRDDLLAAHRAALVRSRVKVGVVGAISAEELAPVLDRLFAGLPETGPELPGEAVLNDAGGTQVIDFPSPQSTAVFGHKGVPRDDPDFFAALVMNHILGGGGFSSRLTDEIREKRGLTYGIGTYLASGPRASLMMGSVNSANGTIAEALDLVRAEWQRMAEDGVTETELVAARKYLTGAYPLQFDGNRRIAGALVGLQAEGLPIDYPQTRNTYVEAVTVEDVARAARRFLDPEALRFVVVGQPEGL